MNKMNNNDESGTSRPVFSLLKIPSEATPSRMVHLVERTRPKAVTIAPVAVSAAKPEAPVVKPAPPPAPAPRPAVPEITPEVIRLIVEMLAQRISEQAVREIAEEIVPEVTAMIIKKMVEQASQTSD